MSDNRKIREEKSKAYIFSETVHCFGVKGWRKREIVHEKLKKKKRRMGRENAVAILIDTNQHQK